VAALINRRGNNFADEGPNGLQLGDNGLHHFYGALLFEVAQGAAHDFVEELEPHPPQHALAGQAFADVEVIFQPVVEDDQRQKRGTKGKEKAEAFEFDAPKAAGEAALAEHLIYDQLWNVERGKHQWKGCKGHKDNHDLIALGVPKHISKQIFFHALPQKHQLIRGFRRLKCWKHMRASVCAENPPLWGVVPQRRASARRPKGNGGPRMALCSLAP